MCSTAPAENPLPASKATDGFCLNNAPRIGIEINRAQAAGKRVAGALDELKAAAVGMPENAPAIKLIAGDGRGFVLIARARSCCRVSGRDGWKLVGRLPQTEDFLRRALRKRAGAPL
jgi:hypothetical protein